MFQIIIQELQVCKMTTFSFTNYNHKSLCKENGLIINQL